MTTQADLEVLQRLLEARHSCRAFLPTEVPRATIDAWLRWAR